MSDQTLIKYENVTLCQQENLVLKDINVEIKGGEFIFLLGKVGTGKSTLMKSMYAELPLSEGDAKVLDYNLQKIKRKEIPALRRKIGIVFQDFQLLIDRTVNANLEFVLKATGWKDKKAISDQITHVLKQVGMHTKGYKMPHQLSGGEQQRIVIARALLNSPRVILADEPTGNLDPNTGQDIMELLYSIRRSGTTVMVATHNLNWVDMYPGRVLLCENQRLLDITDDETKIKSLS
ncbi:MAG: ATP-binding cassette domain-containing protein [Bacteroidales bacterium]|nr:ATP-binding cassette domain-containing protein [Bacteroidales bacterium]